MTIRERIDSDLKEAMIGKDEVKVSTLRFLISRFGYAKIEKGAELTNEDVLSEIGKEAKKHRESIEAYKNGGREDLVAKETAELKILEGYLPAQLTDEEIGQIVDEAVLQSGAKSISEMGNVMKAAMAKVAGRADGGRVSEAVKSKLAS